MSAAENKQLVLSWMQLGQTAEGCRALATDDFTWHIAKSVGPLIGGGKNVLQGEEAFRRMDRIQNALYADGAVTFKQHFMIADEDWVVIMANVAAKTFDGEDYDNDYVFCFRCRDGKVAEFWEHTDTKFWFDSTLSRPDQLADITRRLAEPRSLKP